MAAGIPVMSEAQWARIIAKAYIDGTTGDLEKDPKAFVDGVVRGAPDLPGMNLPNPVRLMSLDYSNWLGGPDSVAVTLLAIFQGQQGRLQEIFNHGTLDGQRVELPPGEFVDPSGLTIRLFRHSAAAIPLTDWMRIYAFVWHQFRFAQPNNIREHFEENPADTIAHEIVQPNGPVPLTINYVQGITPLFTLGAPPPNVSPLALTDIRNDPGAKGYRHRIRMSC